jgi:hypothetical protein
MGTAIQDAIRSAWQDSSALRCSAAPACPLMPAMPKDGGAKWRQA